MLMLKAAAREVTRGEERANEAVRKRQQEAREPCEGSTASEDVRLPRSQVALPCFCRY